MARKRTFILTLFFGLLIAFFVVGLIASRTSNDVLSDQQLALANNPLVNDVPSESSSPIRLITGKARFIHADPTGRSIKYYAQDTGDIVTLSLKGVTSSSLRDTTILAGAQDISWSPDGKQLFAMYINGTQYHNIETGDSHGVNSRIHYPTFSRSSDVISYVYFNEETQEGNISISDPAITSFKNILFTRAMEWDMEWISGTRIAVKNRAENGSAPISLSILDTEARTMASIIDSKDYMETLWSPKGDKVVYSFYNTRSGFFELRMVDLRTREDKEFNISTLASKCAWRTDNQTIYCAAPETPIDKGGLIRSTDDTFVSINTSLSSPTPRRVSDNTHFDVLSMVYVSLEESLVFINENNGSLYQLRVN